MCLDPATLTAMTVMNIAGAAVGHIAGVQAAEAQGRAVADQAAAQQEAISARTAELVRQQANEANKLSRQTMAEAATFDTIAAEFGGGQTAARMGAVLDVKAGEDIATLAGNHKAQLSQLGRESNAVASRAKSQLASIDKPSILGTALKIGGAAMGDPSMKNKTLSDIFK